MSVAPYTPSGEVDDTSPDTDRSVAMSELRKDDPNEEGQQKEKDNNDGDDDDDDNPKPLSKRDNSDLLNLTLHQVARSGDANIAKILLSYMHGNKVKKINMKDKDCVTPLHYAARNEHLEVMKVLIEHGAEVNVVDDELMTPLHYAARYKRERNKKDSVGDSDSLLTKPSTYNRSLNLRDTDKMGEVDPGIVYLVEKGAVLNQEDKYGLTPLHYAAMRGNELALRQLLTYSDINIEAEDKQGMRALHMAATHNHEEEVGILIQANADLRCKDNEDITPLHCAAYEGNIGVVKLLFEEASKRSGNVMISEMMSDKDCDKNTCLHHAVQNGSVEIVKLCLEYKADVNIPSINNMYPLHQAAKVGDLDCVKLLVKHKARIDCVNEDMATPLHLAAANNHEDIVKYLVKKRASLDKKDKDCYTPLLMAAYTGHGSIVHFLIDKGANAAALDKDDKTAVYLAAEEDKGEALKEMLAHPQVLKLIEYGDRYDNHPLHVAAQEGFLDVVTILLDHGAMIECKNEEEQTPLHLAAKYGRTRVVKELVQKKKTSVNDEDENSDTPLHLAADNGHKKVVNVLLQYGADVAARNSLLWTPLDCAAEKGRLKIVRILLDADAPIDATDKTNTTPLLLAAKNGHENVVTYLLEHQANISQRDSDGNNCLDLAIDSNKPEVALAILNSKNWEDAMRNETRDPYTEIRSTPMRKLIKKMPEVAEQVFLKCMVANQVNPEHENYKVTFNYEFLDDTYSDWGEKGSSEQGSSIGSTYNEDFTLSAGVTPYTKDSAVLKKNHPLMIMVGNIDKM